jgi:hypothetical protein
MIAWDSPIVGLVRIHDFLGYPDESWVIAAEEFAGSDPSIAPENWHTIRGIVIALKKFVLYMIASIFGIINISTEYHTLAFIYNYTIIKYVVNKILTA